MIWDANTKIASSPWHLKIKPQYFRTFSSGLLANDTCHVHLNKETKNEIKRNSEKHAREENSKDLLEILQAKAGPPFYFFFSLLQDRESIQSKEQNPEFTHIFI